MIKRRLAWFAGLVGSDVGVVMKWESRLKEMNDRRKRSGLIEAVEQKIKLAIAINNRYFGWCDLCAVTHVMENVCLRLTSSSVNRPGQNSKSSSRSNDLPASKRAREADTTGASVSSFMLRTPRNCRCEFCDEDKRGALRDRPAW